MKQFVTVIVLCLLAAGCGEGATSAGSEANSSERNEAGSDLPFGIQRCPADITRIAADDEFYRDEPVYVGNNQPIEELTAWANTKPGFEDRWIDRDRNGWVALAFSQDADERQRELEEEFPDVGVVAVAVEWTDAELQTLRDEVFAALEASDLDSYGGSHSVSTGFVSVDVPVLDETNLAPLAPFADDQLCVSGLDPVDAVADGPQPTEGDGWRLLGTQRTGESYRTGLATTAEQYDTLWDVSGVGGDQPAVDFSAEIVIWFGAVYGSGCEIRMDDVVLDLERQLVHGTFVIPGSPVACNDDANPEAYVVAVERSVLPAAPFAIQLNASDPPSGVPEERTLVAVDLRDAGSIAGAGEFGSDPALTDRVDRGYVVTAGGVVEPGFPAIYDLDLSCDFATFGPINGVVWQAANADLGLENPPSAWVEAAEAGVVELEILLEEEPPTLTLSAGGHDEVYEPAPAGSGSDCP